MHLRPYIRYRKWEKESPQNLPAQVCSKSCFFCLFVYLFICCFVFMHFFLFLLVKLHSFPILEQQEESPHPYSMSDEPPPPRFGSKIIMICSFTLFSNFSCIIIHTRFQFLAQKITVNISHPYSDSAQNPPPVPKKRSAVTTTSLIERWFVLFFIYYLFIYLFIFIIICLPLLFYSFSNFRLK